MVIDSKKPLVTGLKTSRPGKDPVRIKIKYERLQNLCYECGRIGHDLRSCSYKCDDGGPRGSGYGNWLGVQAARRIDEIIVVCREDWEELEGGTISEKRNRVVEENLSLKGCELGVGKEPEESHNKKMEGGLGRGKSNDVNERTVTVKGKEVAEIKSEPVCVKRGRGFRRGGGRSMGNLNEEENASKRKEDLSQALVVYGSISPMSEMVARMRRVGLKRAFMGGEDEGQMVKKRKLVFEQEEG